MEIHRLMEIYREFTFEAAHRLTSVPPSHQCSACTVTPSGQRSMRAARWVRNRGG